MLQLAGTVQVLITTVLVKHGAFQKNHNRCYASYRKEQYATCDVQSLIGELVLSLVNTKDLLTEVA